MDASVSETRRRKVTPTRLGLRRRTDDRLELPEGD